MAHVVVGPVTGLWRYPVKSMQGEGLDAVLVSERGFLGDRAYALIDKDSGKVGSATIGREGDYFLEQTSESRLFTRKSAERDAG